MQTDRTMMCRQAMGTEFQITVAHPDAVYARQAMQAALDQLSVIESRLSRFIMSSDISRLNQAAPGESIVVDVSTYDCLRHALQLERETGGAFNIAYASVPRVSSGRAISLDARRPLVCVRVAGVRLDMGGIGKGFALDQMADLLCQWDIRRVLLAASASTLLAVAPPSPQSGGWPVHFGAGRQRVTVTLCRSAISGTGTEVKGRHVTDPATGRPAARRDQVWAQAPTGTWADALSTAFFVMDDQHIRSFCRSHPQVRGWVQSAEGRPIQIGARAVAPPPK